MSLSLEWTNLLYDTTFLSFWPAFELMSQCAGGGNWETVCGWLLSRWRPISTYIFTYALSAAFGKSVSHPTFVFITN